MTDSISEAATWRDALDFLIKKKAFPHAINRILLAGAPGTSKSTYFAQIGSHHFPSFYRVTMHRKMSLDRLLGNFSMAEKNGASVTSFVQGPGLRAYTEGGLLALEEISEYSPETVTLLHALLDDVGISAVMDPSGEVHRPASGFAVVASTNSPDPCASLPEALLDRFDLILDANRLPTEFWSFLTGEFGEEGMDMFLEKYKPGVAFATYSRKVTPRRFVTVARLAKYMPKFDAATLVLGTDVATDLQAAGALGELLS